VQEAASEALRVMAGRGEADLNEEVVLAARATLDSLCDAKVRWQHALAPNAIDETSHDEAAHQDEASHAPSPLDVYFGL